MILDFHTHLGDQRRGADDPREPVTFENMIARLDDEGIDKAILLPCRVSPEECLGPGQLVWPGMNVRDQVLEAAHHKERIIPFGNLDPRWMGNSPKADFEPLLDWFTEHDCKGIGEIVANLPCDDPRVVNMFVQAGKRGLPVVIHNVGFGAGTYGLQDDPGMPRLEKLLQLAPETAICGHGQGFWAEIASPLSPDEKMDYPKGSIAREGALPRLLRQYPNLYGDISAGSGFNALTRDSDYGLRFINEFQDRLLFGTDVCFGDASGRMPHLGFLRELLGAGKITELVFGKITWWNAMKLIGD
jgi:uncharacterized protein